MLRNCSPYTFIILSFLALIMVGTLLLSLPFAHVSGGGFTYFEALFTATSAVTVTGLTVCDVHSTFSIYGEVIVLLLIQLGGLGILTLSSVIILLITKKISFYTKPLGLGGAQPRGQDRPIFAYQEGCLRCATYRGHRSGTALFCLCGTISVVQSSLLWHISLSVCILQCRHLSVS